MSDEPEVAAPVAEAVLVKSAEDRIADLEALIAKLWGHIAPLVGWPEAPTR